MGLGQGVKGGSYEEAQPGLANLLHVGPTVDHSFPGRTASLLPVAEGFDLKFDPSLSWSP